MLCGIGQIFVGGGITGISYLGWFLIVVEQGTTVSGYSWCQIFTDPKKRTYNVFISCYMLFSKKYLGGISWHMKPMPVIFLFSASRDSLYQTWIFLLEPLYSNKMS